MTGDEVFLPRRLQTTDETTLQCSGALSTRHR